MVDEADVNEAMAGPPSRKRPPVDNRPGSPRDRKKQQETPPVRWPNKGNQNGGVSTPLGPPNNKVSPDKNLSQDAKTNNVFPGHGIKRKYNDVNEGANKSLKASKGQLARLQQRLHSKGKLNRKHQPVGKTDAVTSSKNDFVSSILKEAVTSQRTLSGQGVSVLNSHDNVHSKNKLTNSETPEALVDGVVKDRGSKGPSPRLLKRQLAREACEENRLTRNIIFRDIRQPEKSKQFNLCYYIDTDEIPGFFLLLKNHIFIMHSEDTIFIFYM